MANNILTTNTYMPASCADGMLSASKHLSTGGEMGAPTPQVDSRYSETLVSLSKRALPQDCARCIGKYCMLKKADKINGDAVYATHSKLIQNSPRRRPEEAYNRLQDQSDYAEYRDLKEQAELEKETKEAKEMPISAARDLKAVVTDEHDRGLSDRAIEDLYEQDLPLAS